MTRTRQPRGAAAKTKAAIKREAAEDKAKAKRRAAEVALAPVTPENVAHTSDHSAAAGTSEVPIRQHVRGDATITVTLRPRRPSILAELAASPTVRRRWDFNAEQLADIAEAFAAIDAGTISISMVRLARVLKARYDLPWAVTSIRDRLLDLRSTRS